MIRALLLAILLTGCTKEVIRYRQVSVPVPTLPEVPEHLLESYQGAAPRAIADGDVCFGDNDIKLLQEWMEWHKLKVNQLQEVLKGE